MIKFCYSSLQFLHKICHYICSTLCPFPLRLSCEPFSYPVYMSCWCLCMLMQDEWLIMVSWVYLFSRLICEQTVEENILKKANEKRILGDIAIEGGNFNTAFFKKVTGSFILLSARTLEIRIWFLILHGKFLRANFWKFFEGLFKATLFC